MPNTTTALLKALENIQIKLLVHTSYAFLYGNAKDGTEETSLTAPNEDPIFVSAIEVEKQIENSNIPHCLLRMGFLYGPQSEDMNYPRAYREFPPSLTDTSNKQAYLWSYSASSIAIAILSTTEVVATARTPAPCARNCLVLLTLVHSF